MNVLVTGANGQLGNELKRLSDKESAIDFCFTDIEELDITHPEALKKILDKRNILIFIDVIFTGFGNTGNKFCFEHHGVVPDIDHDVKDNDIGGDDQRLHHHPDP